MKITFRLFALLALFFAGTVAVQAQWGDGRSFDPAKRAEMQTALMVDSLSLSEAQAAKVKEINLRYAQQMHELRSQNTDADREVMRTKMTAIREEHDGELKGIMTTEQWNKWTQIRSNMRQNWGGDRGEPSKGQKNGKDKPGKKSGKKKGKKSQ